MKTPNKASSVTARHKAFAAHYIASHDPVKSALDAGYSESAAETQEPCLLEDADVRALISEVERRENDENDVTKMLQAMLRLDLAKGVEIKGRIVAVTPAEERPEGPHVARSPIISYDNP